MSRETKNSKRISAMEKETERVKTVEINELREEYLTLFEISLKDKVTIKDQENKLRDLKADSNVKTLRNELKTSQIDLEKANMRILDLEKKNNDLLEEDNLKELNETAETYKAELEKSTSACAKLQVELDILKNKESKKENDDLNTIKDRLEREKRRVTELEIELNKASKLIIEYKQQIGLKDESSSDDEDDSQDNQNIVIKEKTPNPHFETFSGSAKEDVEDWLYMLEQHFDACYIMGNRKTLLISQYLRETAKSYYKAHDCAKLSWSEFKEKFINRFQSPHYQSELRARLSDLNHSGSVYDYINKFNSIINRIKDMSEEDKKHNFEVKLQNEYKAHVKMRHAKNLEEAMREAMDYELNHYPDRANKNGSSIKVNAVNFNKNKFKYNRQSKYKFNRNKNKTSSNRTNNKSDAKCFSCGKRGHIAINCYSQNKNKNDNTNTSKPFHKNSLIQVNLVDYTESVISLMHVQVQVDQNSANALLDSGSSVSLISDKLATKFNLKWNKTDKEIQIANGNKVEVVGVTEFTEVKVQSSLCKLKFLILSYAPFEVLLGLDWFVSTGAQPDPANRRLNFPGWSIDLNKNLDQEEDEIENLCTYNLTSSIESELVEDSCWDYPGEFGIKTETALSAKQMVLFNKFAKANSDLLIKDYKDLGCCNIAKHNISTVESKPIFIRPYRKSFAERKELKLEVKRLLEAGIIRPSKSPWSAPVILIPKPPSGPEGIKEKRFCTDYRALNKITPQDHHPLPRIDNIFDELGGSRYFSSIDLKCGYWQIPLDEESIPKTAFSTPDGHYEWLRVPFGLRNAPADFSRIMFQIFGDLPFVQLYLDDITVHSETFEEHIEHLKIVCDRLRKANLKINALKCKWAAKSIKLLGFIISDKGIEVNNDKIKAVLELKSPRNVKEVQKFLGFINYYRKLIQDLAIIAAPLYKLLKTGANFAWSNECEEAFGTLKSKLTMAPILRFPNFKKKFIIQCDASGLAVGAILSQIDDAGNEYVCSYASRLLKGAELHYSITEKECLAVIYAVKLFRVYVYGVEFDLITDHIALSWLMKLKDATGRLMRWSLYLQEFNFTIKYRKGLKHTNVDMLSRPVLSVFYSTPSLSLDESSKYLDPYEDSHLMYYLKNYSHLSGASRKQVNRVNKLAEHYMLDNDVLKFRHNKIDYFNLSIPKPSERENILISTHRLGHFGHNSCFDQITKKGYYWRNLSKDIERIVNSCDECHKFKITTTFNHPAQTLNISGIFNRVGVDLVLGLPSTHEGYNGIIVFTEYLSKFPQADPITSKSADEIAEKFFDYISLFGPPKEIISDQGREFWNKVVDSLTKITGIERVVTSSYHPQTNGMVERFNQTVIKALMKHVNENKLEWHKWLPYVLFAYRTRIHSTTKLTPYELIYGRPVNNFNSWVDEPDQEESTSLYLRSMEIRNLIENNIPSTLDLIKTNQSKQKETQNSRQNSVDLPLRTKVFIRNEQIQNKLEPKYDGPYFINGFTRNKNYWLVDSNGRRFKESLPLSRLKIIPTDENALDQQTKQQNEQVNQQQTPLETQQQEQKQAKPAKKRGRKKKSDTIKPIQSEPTEPVQPKTRTTRNSNKIFFILLTMFWLFYGVAGVKINGEFHYCQEFNQQMSLDLNNACKPHKLVINNTNQFVGRIVTKDSNIIDGVGHRCRKVLQIVDTEESFWGFRSALVTEKTIKLTPGECDIMIKTNKCEGHVMDCMDERCTYKAELNYQYSWWSPLHFKFYSCQVEKVHVIGQRRNSSLFQDKDCKYDNFFCERYDSIIIWNESVYHKCPFSLVTKANISVNDNLFLTDTNLLFQIIKEETYCDTKMYLSSAGLYLIDDKSNLTLNSFKSIKMVENLLIADSDYKDFVLNEKNARVLENIYNMLCHTSLSLLKFFLKFDDEFFILHGLNNDFAIFYSNNGRMYVPRCSSLSEIAIVQLILIY